ncbi:hypothetical protein Cgig2_032160 [Carnegiea gigantea]|uniref:Uncharacterized protein n=1 Tax=Carnegiea gigantea TaxID=171969 RepID=A0A9Q1JT96_9CARY|nr:hypothetical protein Cgig2_032160 [Carnegiea gigantea]
MTTKREIPVSSPTMTFDGNHGHTFISPHNDPMSTLQKVKAAGNVVIGRPTLKKVVDQATRLLRGQPSSHQRRKPKAKLLTMAEALSILILTTKDQGHPRFKVTDNGEIIPLEDGSSTRKSRQLSCGPPGKGEPSTPNEKGRYHPHSPESSGESLRKILFKGSETGQGKE